MSSKVNQILNSIDKIDNIKNTLINGLDAKREKKEKKLIEEANKYYTGEYLIKLQNEVENKGMVREKEDLKDIICAVGTNSKSLTLEEIRLINKLECKYGEDISNKKSFLDKLFEETGE